MSMSNIDYEKFKEEFANIDTMPSGKEKLIRLLDYKKRLINCGNPTPFMHCGYPGLLNQTETAITIENIAEPATGARGTEYTIQGIWDLVTGHKDEKYSEAFRAALYRECEISKGKVTLTDPQHDIPKLRKKLIRF